MGRARPGRRRAVCYTAGVRPFLLLASLALLLVACAPSSGIRSARPVTEIAVPTFSVVPGQTRVESFDPPGAGATARLAIGARVHNPNPFPVRVEALEYSVALNGQVVTRGRLEPDLFLSREGAAPLRFDVLTELSRRPELLRAVARSFAAAPLAFRVEGRLTFSSLSYRFTTSRRTLLEGEMRAREEVRPPRLRLDETQSEVYLLRPDVPVVRAVVTVENPGDIGYFLYGKDLTVSLGGHLLAQQDMRPVPVPAGEDSRVDVLFYPRLDELDEPARAALQAALDGIPTSLELGGRLLMDVLGVDTFAVPDGWEVFGFVGVEGGR